MRVKLPPSTFGPTHADFAEISAVEKSIRHALGQSDLPSQLGALLRNCIDDVIATPKTGRCDYEELEKTEKTYIGTRVEIDLRALLKFPKGKLDLRIADFDVDIKFTSKDNWMIPTEAIDKICILIAADEVRGLCYFGLLKTKLAYLTPGTNKDEKRSISAQGFSNINWLVAAHPYPPNFWRAIPANKREAIFSPSSGNERLVTLFEQLQETPINRSAIESVAQQKDYMKRLRTNGGARDELQRKGILLLSGKYDSAAIKAMGLPYCDNDSFISTTRKP